MHDLDALTTLFGDAVSITGGKLRVARADALATPLKIGRASCRERV